MNEKYEVTSNENLSDLKNQLFALNYEKNSLENDNMTLKQNMHDIQSRLEALSEENQTYRSITQIHDNKISSLENELKYEKLEKSNKNLEFNELSSKLNQLLNEYESLKLSYSKKEMSLDSLSEQYYSLQTSLGEVCMLCYDTINDWNLVCDEVLDGEMFSSITNDDLGISLNYYYIFVSVLISMCCNILTTEVTSIYIMTYTIIYLSP